MKSVLEHVLRCQRDYAQRPFFNHLRNQALAPRQRLKFLPCMAPFMLGFRDLNRHALRLDPTEDPCQQTINGYICGGSYHDWPGYLDDLAKLGHDQPGHSASRTLRMLASDSTKFNRMLPCRLAHLAWNVDPKVKLALIEAIEATEEVLVSLTWPLAASVQADSGIALRFVGGFLSDLQTGRTITSRHPELGGVVLSTDQRERALQCVDEVFRLFVDWSNELLSFAEEALRFDAEASLFPSSGDFAP